MHLNLSGRSFLCRVLQIRRNFATTCTQKSTQGAKLQADATLCGRSMVEMLGVLAIIGVLSVGAIAGYSKAMFKYKLNKQAEQLNTVFNAVARNVHSFDNLSKTMDITNYFIKLNEFPLEMIKNDNSRIYDIFDTPISIEYGVFALYTRLIVSLTPNLDVKSTENLEICHNILKIAKENAGNIHHLSIVGNYGQEEQSYLTVYGDAYITKGNLSFKELTLDNIYNLCTSVIEKENPHIKVIWHSKGNTL